ncbi:Stress responsive A/B Barrel Domain protein [compost metagenome]
MLKSLEIGSDILHSERSYDIVLIARMDSRDQLEAYDNHPVHVEVKAHMKQVLEASKAVDFEA